MSDEFLELQSPTTQYVEIIQPSVEYLEVLAASDILTVLEQTTEFLEVSVPAQGSLDVLAPVTEYIEILHGPKGDRGDPGAGIQEVYIQQNEPSQGQTPWLLAQTDINGNVQFLKVYEP